MTGAMGSKALLVVDGSPPKAVGVGDTFKGVKVISVNGDKTDRSDHKVGAGDVLTMVLHGRIVVWRIIDPGERRGPASEAQGLYEDLSPPPLPRAPRTTRRPRRA